MSTPLFDSRKLDGLAYFACQLAPGTYTLASAEFASLTGQIIVEPGTDKAPESSSATLTLDDQGKLVLATPSPITVKENAYLLFEYFTQRDDAVLFSLQISGELTTIDSRTLTDGQIFGRPLQPAGVVTCKAYLLVPGTAGAPPQYVLQQQGDIKVQDDAPIGDPVVAITLDPAGSPFPDITIPTYTIVTWQIKGGPWYLEATIVPSEETPVPDR
jgi:hypothetical protein